MLNNKWNDELTGSQGNLVSKQFPGPLDLLFLTYSHFSPTAKEAGTCHREINADTDWNTAQTTSEYTRLLVSSLDSFVTVHEEKTQVMLVFSTNDLSFSKKSILTAMNLIKKLPYLHQYYLCFTKYNQNHHRRLSRWLHLQSRYRNVCCGFEPPWSGAFYFVGTSKTMQTKWTIVHAHPSILWK